MNLIGNASSVLMKLYLFLVVVALSFFVTFYSKGFFQLKSMQFFLGLCTENPEPVKVAVTGVLEYLAIIWLCMAISLIPFTYLIQNADGTINETGTKILQNLYGLVYNLPIYILSALLLVFSVIHLSSLGGKFCTPGEFFHPLEQLTRVPGTPFFFPPVPVLPVPV